MWPALLVLDVLLISRESAIGEDFNDLGKLMLGGFVAAVAVALALTFVRFRLRDKKQETSQFISISAPRDDKG